MEFFKKKSTPVNIPGAARNELIRARLLEKCHLFSREYMDSNIVQGRSLLEWYQEHLMDRKKVAQSANNYKDMGFINNEMTRLSLLDPELNESQIGGNQGFLRVYRV